MNSGLSISTVMPKARAAGNKAPGRRRDGLLLLQSLLRWGWVSFIVWLFWNNAIMDFLEVGRMNGWAAAGIGLLARIVAPLFRDPPPAVAPGELESVEGADGIEIG